MSVATTTARIATMWQNFSDDANGQHIEKAFPRIPRQLLQAHLPGVITFPGNATYDYDQYGERLVKETRTYRCVVAVSLATAGSLETGEAGVEPYFSAARDYFAARPGLEDDSASEPQERVHNARVTGDQGYFIFEYPSGNQRRLFHAMELTLEVEELVKITYKD